MSGTADKAAGGVAKRNIGRAIEPARLEAQGLAQEFQG